MPENLSEKLQILADTIAACRRCDNAGLSVDHCPPLFRGEGRRIFVIGEQPGSQEQDKGVAFSGAAGKRLRQWLITAGVADDEDGLFQACYFTSLIKCRTETAKLKRAFRNCRTYLTDQLDLVKPDIVCTLGLAPPKFLYGYQGTLEKIVGTAYAEHELHDPGMFPIHQTHIKIIPLPHPSPLSHWLNERPNRLRLTEALKQITIHISGTKKT